MLGTYHMSNTGHDMCIIEADDVLSGKRQQEIAQLPEILKRFHPTKIATEAEVEASTWPNSIPTTPREVYAVAQ